MTPKQQAAFEKLLAAKSAYIGAHAFEVDQGGSIRDIRTAGLEDILEDLFHTEVVHFEQKKWPALSQNQIKTGDALLGGEYDRKLQQLRSQTEEETNDGAVTAERFSRVQKTWEAYRDAWFVFAHLRYLAAADFIRAEIILDRYRLEKTILPY
jgi:hypothetical protein